MKDLFGDEIEEEAQDEPSLHPKLRSGVFTTEFWMSAMGVVAGLVLVSLGIKTEGVALVTTSIVGYNAARGLTKMNQ